MVDYRTDASTFTGDRPTAAAPEALVDRHQLAFVAFERTRMAIVIADARQADCPIVMANQAFLDLTGYAADEVIGRNCRFLQGPDTDPVALAALRRAIRDRQPASVEFRNYRKDGTSFWNQLRISPILDDAGQLIYFFGSQMDISDSRRARALEASEHRLLQEVDHRAMNALAMVQAIVRLSRTDSVERYAEIVQGRVGALARAHVALARGGWTASPLDTLLQGEVQALGLKRTSINGAAAHVAPDQVQPLLLVLHEMFDDCTRQGALAADAGALAIECWRGDPEARFGLHWRESGGAAAAASRTPEFTSALVTSLVERQLKGKLSWSEGRAGLEATLALPVL